MFVGYKESENWKVGVQLSIGTSQTSFPIALGEHGTWGYPRPVEVSDVPKEKLEHLVSLLNSAKDGGRIRVCSEITLPKGWCTGNFADLYEASFFVLHGEVDEELLSGAGLKCTGGNGITRTRSYLSLHKLKPRGESSAVVIYTNEDELFGYRKRDAFILRQKREE